MIVGYQDTVKISIILLFYISCNNEKRDIQT